MLSDAPTTNTALSGLSLVVLPRSFLYPPTVLPLNEGLRPGNFIIQTKASHTGTWVPNKAPSNPISLSTLPIFGEKLVRVQRTNTLLALVVCIVLVHTCTVSLQYSLYPSRRLLLRQSPAHNFAKETATCTEVTSLVI